ncbi:MAG: sugar ABC transporter permease [Polyangiaceae bacterium]
MRPKRWSDPYLFLLPTLVTLAVFFFVPLLSAIKNSFYSWDMLTPPVWVGAGNYEALVRSGELWGVLGRTAGYSVIVVTGSVSLGLFLAVVLDRPGRVYAFVRGAVFSAYVVSWVAVALLWMWLLDADAGVVGGVVRFFGGKPVSWLSDPDRALWAVALVSVWKLTGYSMVIFLAGLQDVPKSVLEAAALDGAGPFRRFREVTWPLLRPSAAFVATTSLLASFQAFDVVRVMTQGGPVKATTLFVYAIYEHVFVNLRVGRASALTVVFFGVLLAATGLQLAAFRAASRRGGGRRREGGGRKRESLRVGVSWRGGASGGAARVRGAVNAGGPRPRGTEDHAGAGRRAGRAPGVGSTSGALGLNSGSVWEGG